MAAWPPSSTLRKMTSVSSRIVDVRERIASAAISSGRSPGSVHLIAVSKTKPSALIREAYSAGQRDFGENYVQELVMKAEELRDLVELRWHMIGHLQRNKARLITQLTHRIHAVDSERLATELSDRASAEGIALSVLVEVNVGGESSKSGCTPENAAKLRDAIAELPGLRLRGLMTIPPASDDPTAAQPYFDQLAKLRDTLGGPSVLPELSMGMTDDLEQAIAAGATWVRVGTAIFGAREPRA